MIIMRNIFFILLTSFVQLASAQFSIPSYTVRRDSASHLTVFHTGSAEKAGILTATHSDSLALIPPDVRIKNGIVDHKGPTGEMLVREYFADSVLIGYIEYDAFHFLRERYFYPDGSIFMDKQYDQGTPFYTDRRKYHPIRK